jgi:pimeloyl-ACP methyl ester carboxylesterase
MSAHPWLLLLHGALMDRRSMLSLAPHLEGEFGLLCPDLAGHGQRQAHHHHLPSLGPRELAGDLLERLPIAQLAAALPLQLVGHSLGALVALEMQNLLHAEGAGAARLVLGDPPLCLSLDTPSQHAAAQGMAHDPVGRRLAHDCFHDFTANNPAAGADSSFLLLLDSISQQVPVHVLHGLLPQHQRADGSIDCGTFLSDLSLQHLRLRCPLVHLRPVADGGHFVFHSSQGLQHLSHCLQAP